MSFEFLAIKDMHQLCTFLPWPWKRLCRSISSLCCYHCIIWSKTVSCWLSLKIQGKFLWTTKMKLCCAYAMGPAEYSVLHTTELNTSSLKCKFNQSNILLNATCISDAMLWHASKQFSLPQMKVWTVANTPFKQQLKPWHITPTKTCRKHFCLFALPHASINFLYKVQQNITIYWLFLILKFAITE